MAHFAKLENNIVTQVIVVNNQVLLDENKNESEQLGIDFCKNLLGGDWIQTSYNGNFRKNYASIGSKYDAELDAFVLPQPFPSWTLDTTIAQWKAPVEIPKDNKMYIWDENTLSWIEPKE